MTTYKMSDGLTVKTQNARESWTVGDETLHVTRRGRFWVEQNGRAIYLDKMVAAEWLIRRGIQVPSDLVGLAADWGLV